MSPECLPEEIDYYLLSSRGWAMYVSVYGGLMIRRSGEFRWYMEKP